ncbi:capsule associated protein [Xylariaceae sp. FL0016]|nr:capsule associated protein [Xylariaceae sp. FL0016]
MRVALLLSRRPLRALRSLGCYAVVLGFIALYYLLFLSSFGPSALQYSYSRNRLLFDNYYNLLKSPNSTRHPIDDLIIDAKRTQDLLLTERSHDLETAAARYRRRRGRHPPPGFDKWFEYASKNDAIVIEKFFDRIEHDLRPFWARDPKLVSKLAADGDHVVSVRGGVAHSTGDIPGHVPWLQLWTGLVSGVSQWLPDVDMPINYWDESRVFVPWENISSWVAEAEREKRLTAVDNTIRQFTGLAHLHADDVKAKETEWITTGASHLWDIARAACPPDSPAHDAQAIEDFSVPPRFPTNWHPAFSENGFVKNYTASMNPCFQPHLRDMSGAFIQWALMNVTRDLIPMFGGCKLTMNNEILIPGAMYLSHELRYTGGWNHGPLWEDKRDGVIWRGVASGGRHEVDNWSHFQRFRLVQMLNGTTVSQMAEHPSAALTFTMPSNSSWSRSSSIESWLKDNSDAGFIYLQCYPENECGYLEPFFKKVGGVSMANQYHYKYLPDVDGNSFSARFRSQLLSTSLPLKSTIFAEWHDDRLSPWVHFVSLDNTLQDLYSVLDYFLADEKGDAAAQFIAETGRLWAENVLKRDDMLLYVWRLLLEFARVCDINRDSLGFVDDLL